MAAHSYTARRATLEDLPALKGLWEIARLPALDLEKQLTEFQIIARPDGVMVGAVALRVTGPHGVLHSEAFYSASQASEVRPLVWPRLLALARSRGIARLWLRGPAGPFWQEAGFHQATAAELEHLPPFVGGREGDWTTLQLPYEAAMSDAMQKRFDQFHEAEQAGVERIRRQAQFLKWLAALVAVVFLGGACWLLFESLRRARNRRRLPH